MQQVLLLLCPCAAFQLWHSPKAHQYSKRLCALGHCDGRMGQGRRAKPVNTWWRRHLSACATAGCNLDWHARTGSQRTWSPAGQACLRRAWGQATGRYARLRGLRRAARSPLCPQGQEALGVHSHCDGMTQDAFLGGVLRTAGPLAGNCLGVSPVKATTGRNAAQATTTSGRARGPPLTNRAQTGRGRGPPVGFTRAGGGCMVGAGGAGRAHAAGGCSKRRPVAGCQGGHRRA